MFSLLLAIIYLAFMSLGLPDSLLGSAWPAMQEDLQVPISYAGTITMIISGGTIVSSLQSDRLTRRLGTGVVTAVSVGLTAAALFGFSFSSAYWMLCLWAVPYGLGAGAVDAALNNYVALHYSSRQMSWLHAFWGVGVTISPYIMSFCLSREYGWENGYRSVAVIQTVLVVILVVTLPLWKKAGQKRVETEEVIPKVLSIPQILKIKGVPFVLIAFWGYCALEWTAGLWASSYMVDYRGVSVETAAGFVAVYYLGITIGRVLTGFVADKLGDKQMIRIGILIMAVGVMMIILPFHSTMPALLGLITIGLGSAPVYPCIIHATPSNFGRENSQSLVGIQMASAYIGTTFMPPVFGLIAQHVSVAVYPFYLGILVIIMFAMTEILNRKVKEK